MRRPVSLGNPAQHALQAKKRHHAPGSHACARLREKGVPAIRKRSRRTHQRKQTHATWMCGLTRSSPASRRHAGDPGRPPVAPRFPCQAAWKGVWGQEGGVGQEGSVGTGRRPPHCQHEE
eukprot:353698-Chlamydomonas_euryale.AAC.9